MKLLKLLDDFNRYVNMWLAYYKEDGRKPHLYTKDLTIDKNRIVCEAVFIDANTKEKIHIIKQYANVKTDERNSVIY